MVFIGVILTLVMASKKGLHRMLYDTEVLIPSVPYSAAWVNMGLMLLI